MPQETVLGPNYLNYTLTQLDSLILKEVVSYTDDTVLASNDKDWEVVKTCAITEIEYDKICLNVLLYSLNKRGV